MREAERDSDTEIAGFIGDETAEAAGVGSAVVPMQQTFMVTEVDSWLPSATVTAVTTPGIEFTSVWFSLGAKKAAPSP